MFTYNTTYFIDRYVPEWVFSWHFKVSLSFVLNSHILQANMLDSLWFTPMWFFKLALEIKKYFNSLIYTNVHFMRVILFASLWQLTLNGTSIIAMWAFEWFFPCVNSYVSFEIRVSFKRSWTIFVRTYERWITRMAT